MSPPSVMYIIDKSTTIQCGKCGTYEHPALFIDGDALRMNGVVKCTKCGAMICYNIQTVYQATNVYSMLQEIKKEEDLYDGI